MKETKPYTRLLALLPVGKEKGVSRKALSEELRIRTRDVSDLVLKARRDNYIIASGNTGYFVPATDGELLEYYLHSRRMAITILTSIKTTRRELKRRGILPKGV